MSGAGLVYTLLIAALIAFFLYRRVRRNLGRQDVTPKRFVFRIVLLALVGGFIFVSLLGFFGVAELAEVLAGLVVGAGAAFYGLRLTEFGSDERGAYYVPNRYLGLAVSALLVARIAYRFLHTSLSGGQASGQAAFRQAYDPVSSALLFVFVGYYVVYYAGVLLESRKFVRGGAA